MEFVGKWNSEQIRNWGRTRNSEADETNGNQFVQKQQIRLPPNQSPLQRCSAPTFPIQMCMLDLVMVRRFPLVGARNHMEGPGADRGLGERRPSTRRKVRNSSGGQFARQQDVC